VRITNTRSRSSHCRAPQNPRTGCRRAAHFAVSDPSGADTTVLDGLGVEAMSGIEAGIAATFDPMTLGSRAPFPDVDPRESRKEPPLPRRPLPSSTSSLGRAGDNERADDHHCHTKSEYSVFVHREKRMTRAPERIQRPESSQNRIINVRHTAADTKDVQCGNYGSGGSAAHTSAKASVYRWLRGFRTGSPISPTTSQRSYHRYQ
jgi:hypothetical protein